MYKTNLIVMVQEAFLWTVATLSRLFTWAKGYLSRLVNIGAYVDVGAADAAIRANVAFKGPNVLILFCAVVIASVGLNVNAIPVVIGAMLVSPLMGPILGVGLALATNDVALLRHALKHLGIMVAVSLLAAVVYFVVTPLRMDNPSELLARTNPTIYDALIAFFGGFAGLVETARKERGTVVAGVAIATALMPPLCTVGFGIAQLNWHYALGALYLFSINAIFIALATFVGAKYLRFATVSYAEPRRRTRVRWTIGVAVLLLMAPSVVAAVSLVRQNNFERAVSQLVAHTDTDDIYDYKVSHHRGHSEVVLVVGNGGLPPSERREVLSAAAALGIDPSQVVFSSPAEQPCHETTK